MEIRVVQGVAKRKCLRQFSSPLRTPLRCRYSSTNAKAPQQVHPLGGYYELLLFQPGSAVSKPSQKHPRETQKAEIAAKARIVFGSRLAGPVERAAELRGKSTLIAGVWVPPKPQEPDNCCMSGCVNCVWDRYGEEVEEWAAKKREADVNLRKENAIEHARQRRRAGHGRGIQGAGMKLGKAEGAEHKMISIDDDGAGNETNWGSGLESDLFRDVPVGILEFMKQEKRLKEKHLREGTSGG